jgi:AcrR family transcriptional regulator
VVDARILRSKDKIRATFIDLLQIRELEEVTIRDVSTASGVGYSTYYRHYATKEELLTEIAEFEVSELVDLTYPLLLTRPAIDACRTCALHVESRRRLWTALTSGTASAILREKLTAGLLKYASHAKIGSGFLPLSISAAMCSTIMVELLTWWLRQEEHSSPEYLAEALDRMIVEPAFQCW